MKPRDAVAETSPTQSLCDQFALGKLQRVSRADGTRNVNFIIQTERGAWFVRQRFAGYCADEHLAFDHGAARFLAELGVLPAPPRRALNGQTWWRDGERTWEVFAFISGHHLRDGNEDDAAALGAALAQWHRAGKNFPLRFEKAAPRGETDPQQLQMRIAKIENEAIENEAPVAVEILVGYRNAIEHATAALPDREYSQLPRTLIHGDVQPANILMSDGKVCAFVDLDWCAWQARLYDLCFALLLSCANHDTPFDGADIWSLSQTPRFSGGAIASFLAAYETCDEPLNANEKQALLPQLVLTFCHVRLGGALKVPALQRAAFLERAPQPAELSALISGVLHPAI